MEPTPTQPDLTPMQLTPLDTAIDGGIAFLAEHQFHHGEFCVYMGAGEDLKQWCVPDSTTFATAIISALLLPLKDNPAVEAMQQKAGDFLKYQMMRGGAWHYFTKWHKIFQVCPADVDDTACISFFLKEIHYSFPDNLSLLRANRNKKGLYYTWFTFRYTFRLPINKTYWLLALRELKYPLRALWFWTNGECRKNDVDAVVNANILYYLGENAHTAPVIPFLLQIIEDHQEAGCDKWYQNIFQVYYAIARNFHKGVHALEPAREPIIERIRARMQPDGCIGHSTGDTAMAITTLLNFGYIPEALEKAVDYLLKTVSPNGSWPRHAMCWSGRAQLVAWGSEELTTALCLEALARYRQVKINQTTANHILHETT
jgi:hypothetical protein